MKFDSDAARRLDDTYHGSDYVRRRLASFNALAPVTGDRVLDIGCGPGFSTIELARAVGDQGEVIGLDMSQDMLKAARLRCQGRDNIQIVEGTANAIPLDDASIDRALSIQVFEYIKDLPGALAEANRVLKSGARLVIADMHYESVIWHSEHPERMQKMLTVWNHYVVELGVAALLPPLLRDAGFTIERIEPLTFIDTTLKHDGLAKMSMEFVAPFAVKNGLMAKTDVAAWTEEQYRFAREGRFFFSITQFIVSASKV